VNIESKGKLIEIIKLARASMSQRAFGKVLGVSATAVQLREKGIRLCHKWLK
jgi:DNA-binding XRE family transcriptional regulator